MIKKFFRNNNKFDPNKLLTSESFVFEEDEFTDADWLDKTDPHVVITNGNKGKVKEQLTNIPFNGEIKIK